MDALHTLLVMMASAVVGVFVFKTFAMVLPEGPISEPIKKIGAFL